MRYLTTLVFLIGITIYPDPSECVYCPTYRCYGSCGFDCSCVTPPGGGGGECWGIERVPALLEKGWKVVK